MRTLIVSDLHLGSNAGIDLLRREDLRASLIEQVAEVDRLVLLGDVLELRHGPLRDALAAARPAFEGLARVLAGKELVLVAGNHDHGLIEPWLAARGADSEPPPLGLEQRIEPAEASPALARLAEWAAPARVSVAYPGLWVRDDVYAMHGHYLDAHLTVPTLERLSVGAMSRILSRPATAFDSVEDYEAVSAPVFAWRDVVARDTHPGAMLNGMATVAAWRALGGGENGGAARRAAVSPRALLGHGSRRLRRAGMVAGFPLAVAALNRAGIGPLRADISGVALRRAGLQAMGQAAHNLGLGDSYVVFGHTHRSGPHADDDAGEWIGSGGARLVNTGSWVYAEIFLGSSGPANPYWPGGAVLVPDSGPPRPLCLLADRSPRQLLLSAEA